MRRLAPLLATALAACAHGKGALPTGPEETTPQKLVDRGVLADELRVAVLDSYRVLGEDYEEAYLDGVARDDHLILIDVKPDDVVIGFSRRACTIRRQFPERRLDVVSKDLEVRLSHDLTVAWTHDDLSYRVEKDGRTATIPMRATAVYERREGRWLKVLEHVSYGIPDDDAFAAALAGRAPRGADLPADVSGGEAAAKVRKLVEALIADSDDTRTKHVSTADDALLLGSDPEREVRGAKLAELATIRALYGYDLRARATGLRVVVSRSGTVAWAAASVVVEGGRDGRPLSLPLRATWVLELRDGEWIAVQTHVSLAVSQEVLALRAFGETLAQSLPRNDRSAAR